MARTTSTSALELPQVTLKEAVCFDNHHWNWDETSCPYWRLWWNPQAGAQVEWGQRFDLDSDHLVLVAPGTRIRLRQVGVLRHTFIHFTLAAPFRQGGPLVMRIPLDVSGQRLVRGISGRLAQGSPDNWVGLSLLALISGALVIIDPDYWLTPSMDPRIGRSLEIMEQEIERPLANADLAGRVGMSPTAFSRRFHHDLGCSPHRYLLGRRIERAAERLRTTDEAISQIAQACGFCDRFYFGRVFKDAVGASPAAYRLQSRPETAPGATDVTGSCSCSGPDGNRSG